MDMFSKKGGIDYMYLDKHLYVYLYLGVILKVYV